MRTTLTIDDRLLHAIKRKAAERNVPVKSIIDQALRHGLEVMECSAAPQPYRTQVRSLGLKPGLDADRLGQIAQELEDEERVRRGT